ncbi:unnamed protein product [Cunninghamella echinulata]
MTVKIFAISRNETLEWNTFVKQNDWVTEALKNKTWDNEEENIPRKCRAIYYIVNKNEKQIKDKIYLTTYDPDYKDDFKKLNVHWIEKYFKIEPSDIQQLDHAEENIIQPGGEIFFVVVAEADNNYKKKVVGTVAMVVENGECELAKLAVDDQHQSKGYSHPLMQEAIQWAKNRNHSEVLIVTNTMLEGAVNLYKKYGFETIHLGKHPHYERVDIVMKLTF